MRADTLCDRTLHLPGGRRVAWREYGDPRGRPVVYCHGMPGSRLEPFPGDGVPADAGLRFIVPDRPGYGGTDPRAGRTLGEEAADVEALADRLDLETFDVLGFSGGGPHALALAQRFPRRVLSLTLVSSWAPFQRAGLEGMADANRQLWELAEADFPAFAHALGEAVSAMGGAYDLLVGGAPEADRAIFEDAAVAAAYRRSLEEAMRQGLDGMLEDAAALIAPWDFDVAEIRCPVRLWHGDGDVNAPVGMGRWLARHLPEAELTEWPGAAHFASFGRRMEILADLAPA
ncbi:alpha/beta fold hydrolase [Thiohalorhabdus methylotrophus]|uniref:Alpha/beta fold hydrolase n=1 Tax=Thiohalorhabdus methylotrophus TaxID=3242694 RepID=A0ABV4TS35_9GAMM